MKQIKIVAPGRVCLFGDHQDYLGLPIIACAINRYMYLVAFKNSTDTFEINLPDIQQKLSLSVESDLDEINVNDFFKSALRRLQKYGCIPSEGYTIEISSNIAINAGTSSSSALTITWIMFLLEAFGCNFNITNELIAKIAFESEVLEHDASGGKMDQYSISLGNVIYLETDKQSKFKTIGTQIEGLIVAESGIPKPTDNVLKELKENVLKAIYYVSDVYPGFDLKSTRTQDINMYLEVIPKELHKYFEAAVENHSITKQALSLFQKDTLDQKVIGELMTLHHQILKNKLDLTVPKIDKMISIALDNGAYGAKIVGSGRGGCIVVIALKEKHPQIIKELLLCGAVNAYSVSVDKGARIEK